MNELSGTGSAQKWQNLLLFFLPHLKYYLHITMIHIIIIHPVS